MSDDSASFVHHATQYELAKARRQRYRDELDHALKSIVWTTGDDLHGELAKLIETQKTKEEAAWVAAASMAWVLQQVSHPIGMPEGRARALEQAAYLLVGHLSYLAHSRRDTREMKRIAAPVRKEK